MCKYYISLESYLHGGFVCLVVSPEDESILSLAMGDGQFLGKQ